MHTRLSATVIVLVSVLSGSVYSASLAAQVAKPPTGNVLYEAGGFEHWSFPITPDWTRLHGMLLNNGTHHSRAFAPLFAPYRPESAPYAVEAEIRIIEDGDSFGIIVQADGASGGYACGVATNPARTLFPGMTTTVLRGSEPGKEWHTYRIEVKGNVITLSIDGTVQASITKNRLLSYGRVGLWSSRYQLEVRSFKVIALQ